MRLAAWLNTLGLVRRLTAQAASSGDSIVEAFVQAQVPLSPDGVGWGQYIDRPGTRQVGLYGTAAGVGTLREVSAQTSLRHRGIHYLVRRFDGRRTNATDRYQFELLPKIAGFLRSFAPADLTNPRVVKACNELIRELNTAQVPNAGWGFYTSSGSSAISPTCLVLLAVSELGLGSQLAQVQTALSWLAKQVEPPKHKSLHPGELALALLTIRAFQHSHPDENRTRQTKAAHKWLLRQVRISPVAWHEYLVSYTAMTVRGAVQQENDEYFVMPSSLMILQYILGCSRFDLMRPEILAHAIRTVEIIELNNMFVSANRRAASRENQWAYDVCRQLHRNLQSSPKSYAALAYLARFTLLFSKRVAVFSALLFVVILPVFRKDIGAGIGLFVVSVLASILANVLTERS